MSIKVNESLLSGGQFRGAGLDVALIPMPPISGLAIWRIPVLAASARRTL
jgi:hypothetical protein